MKIKKILVVNHTSTFWGGEASLEKVVLAMSSEYEVYFLTPGGELSNRLKEKINIIISHGIDRLNKSSNPIWIIKFIYQLFCSFFEVAWYISKIKPDVVHCFSETAAFYCVLPARFMRKTIICQIHLVIIQSKFWERVSIIIGKFVARYIVISYAVKNRMVSIGHNSEKISVINSGTDTENEFNPKNVEPGLFRQKFDLLDKSFLVALIGSIQPLKGQHLFVQSIDILLRKGAFPNLVFLIIGSPLNEKYYIDLKNMVKSKNLKAKVKLINKVSHRFIPNVLKDIDLFIFTSCIPDAFPRSIIEAMSMGKMIIAAKLGGVKEQVIEGENGLLFNPDSPKELSEKIEFIIKNRECRKKIGSNARFFAIKNYSDRIYKNNILSYYKNFFN